MQTENSINYAIFIKMKIEKCGKSEKEKKNVRQ